MLCCYKRTLFGILYDQLQNSSIEDISYAITKKKKLRIPRIQIDSSIFTSKNLLFQCSRIKHDWHVRKVIINWIINRPSRLSCESAILETGESRFSSRFRIIRIRRPATIEFSTFLKWTVDSRAIDRDCGGNGLRFTVVVIYCGNCVQ